MHNKSLDTSSSQQSTAKYREKADKTYDICSLLQKENQQFFPLVRVKGVLHVTYNLRLVTVVHFLLNDDISVVVGSPNQYFCILVNIPYYVACKATWSSFCANSRKNKYYCFRLFFVHFEKIQGRKKLRFSRKNSGFCQFSKKLRSKTEIFGSLYLIRLQKNSGPETKNSGFGSIADQ